MSRTSASINRIANADLIGLGTGALFFVFAYVRLFFAGEIITDESQYIGTVFLSSIGGRPFYNEMFFQQTGSIIYEPLAQIYHFLFGREGIALFSRHLYFLISSALAIFYCTWFNGAAGRISGLIIGASVLVGTAYSGLPSVSYNTSACVFFGFSLIFALRSFSGKDLRWAAASGVCSAIATFAYPTMGAAAVFQWIFIGLWRLPLGLPFKRQFATATGSGLLTLIFLIGYLVLRFGIDDLKESFYFTIGFSALGSATNKLNYSLYLLSGFAPPPWLFLLLTGLWALLYKFWRASWYWLAVIICCVVVFKKPPEQMAYTAPLILILCLSALPLIIFRLIEDPIESGAGAAIFFSGLAMSPIISWTSGMTLYTTSNATIFSLCGVMSLARTARKAETLVGFIVPLFIGYQQFLHFYPALPPVNFVREGPFLGMFLSPGEYDVLNRVQRDIKLCEQRNAKSALFYDEFAPGVFMSGMAPATRSIFMHGLDQSLKIRHFYTNYYTNPKNRPDCLFRFKSLPRGDVTPKRFHPYPDVFWYYLPEQTREYVLIHEEPDYQVFIKER